VTRVCDLAPADLRQRLRGDGVRLDTGAFSTHLHIRLDALLPEFAALYADYTLGDAPGIDDFEVTIKAPSLLRRFVRPQATSVVDNDEVIEPVPLEHALPCLESALNLAVAFSDISPLVVHSAALERDGRALVMPAPSGSGKSTLCAALAWRGWRLLSDEMAIFSFETGRLLGNPRPVSLKNRAVEVMRAFEPRARFSRAYHHTSKGSIAYMQPPPDAVARAHETAGPGLLIAPVFRAGAPLTLRPMSHGVAFRWLADNAVNYASLLDHGFRTLADFVEGSRAYSLVYSDLDEAIACIGRLHAGEGG
jgi:HprK-related kinase A